jgi:hypothetical protein
MMAKVGEVTTGYRPGEKFLVAVGTFAALEATYIGEDAGKVWATINIFGGARLVELEFEAVPPCVNSIDKISA